MEYNPRDIQAIVFPEGNRDIDFLVSFLNVNLRYGYELYTTHRHKTAVSISYHVK